MSDIEWSPWIKCDGVATEPECPDHRLVIHYDAPPPNATHYRIPMEDYRRITGMPSWDDLPEWAQWLAQDANGKWWFYQERPVRGPSLWQNLSISGDAINRHQGTVLGDWRDTLQERPSDPMDTHPDSELDADQYSVGADAVDHPSHYTSGSIECIDAIQAQMTPEQFAGYLRGNVAKYVWRYEHKGGAESLRKARWYLDRLIAVMEDE